MASSKFMLVGLDRLDRKLKRLKLTIGKKSLRPGLRVMQKIIRKEAMRNSPVASGLLRAAIKVKAGKRSRTHIAVNTVMGKKSFQGATFYGGFLEWGFKTGKRGSSNRRQIEGTQFMSRAVDTKGKGAVDAGIKKMIELLDKEIAKGA